MIIKLNHVLALASLIMLALPSSWLLICWRTSVSAEMLAVTFLASSMDIWPGMGMAVCHEGRGKNP